MTAGFTWKGLEPLLQKRLLRMGRRQGGGGGELCTWQWNSVKVGIVRTGIQALQLLHSPRWSFRKELWTSRWCGKGFPVRYSAAMNFRGM
jgi:hypothetical protein